MTDDVRFHCAHCDFVTPTRSIVELARHVYQMHHDKSFLCDNRDIRVSRVMEGLPDCWQKMPNGDLTCIHCGSLSEEDLFDIIERYLKGDEGYKFGTTNKSYKIYANRPGVQNAEQGGIKFYHHHVDPNHPDFENRAILFDKAVRRSNAESRAMIDNPRNRS